VSPIERLFGVGLCLVVLGLPLFLQADGLAAKWHIGDGWLVGPVRVFEVAGMGLVGLGVIPLATAAWWWIGPPGGSGSRPL
jgi:hypothetical protein